MKKLIIVLLTFSLLGCVNTKVEKNEINKLDYSTVENAKNSNFDSLIIVTQDYKDYVFKKKKDGSVILIGKYISDDNWMDIPYQIFLFAMFCSTVIGIIIGSIKYTNNQ